MWPNHGVTCLQRCYDKDSIANKEDTEMQKVKGSTVHVPETEGILCWKYTDDFLLGSLWSPLSNIGILNSFKMLQILESHT